jgi:hypothetical protein
VSRHRPNVGGSRRWKFLVGGTLAVTLAVLAGVAVLTSGGPSPAARWQAATAAAQAPSAATGSAAPSAAPSASPPAKPRPSTTPGRPAPAPGKGGQSRTFSVTFYGAADNTPPGSRDIAFPKVHQQAGGSGTWADPTTFATDRRELPAGTRIYFAPLRRYFVMEDDCTECDEDFTQGRAHIDLWAGTATDSGIVRCEDSLTRDGPSAVLVNPPPNLPVTPGQLYDNGKCVKLAQ